MGPDWAEMICLPAPQEIIQREADVLSNLPDKNRRNVASLMLWDRRAASIRMPILSVRTALPDLDKAQRFKQCSNLTRLQRRALCHAQPTATS